jgi:hypothetical protein
MDMVLVISDMYFRLATNVLQASAGGIWKRSQSASGKNV